MAHSLSAFEKPIKGLTTHFIRPIFLPSTVEFHVQEDDVTGTFKVSNPDNGKTNIWGTVSLE